MTDQGATTGSASSLTPTHGVLMVLVTSAVVLGVLMGVGFRPKSSK